MKYIWAFLFIILGTTTLTNCGKKTATKETTEPERKFVDIPLSNPDSLYHNVYAQVQFGPRVPGSKAHKLCASWIKQKLEGYGVDVTMQGFKTDFYFGGSATCVNIIGAINPEAKKRVLLACHWDTRFMADMDKKRKDEAIPGADDGGSGVAVLLEIARLLKEYPLADDMGVDLIFFDAEDQGEDDADKKTTLTWCIGSQYWTKNLHKKGYHAKYGILLDMVGAKNAVFTKENVSMAYAPSTMNAVWEIARSKGYHKYFSEEETPGVIDDHYFINEALPIPTINIINKPPGRRFGKHWHTHDDNLDNISKETLEAVANVVTRVLFYESTNQF